MRRRDFIAGLGMTAMLPLQARAQQSAIPFVGFLSSRSPGESEDVVAAFRQGLAEAGYVVGQNVAIEYRWAEGQYDRLPALAGDLVRMGVAAILAAGGPPSALAAKKATTTIPIVFSPPTILSVSVWFEPEPAGRQCHRDEHFEYTLSAKRFACCMSSCPSPHHRLSDQSRHPTPGSKSRPCRKPPRPARSDVKVFKASNDQEIEAAFADLWRSKSARRSSQASRSSTASGRSCRTCRQHAIPASYSCARMSCSADY